MGQLCRVRSFSLVMAPDLYNKTSGGQLEAHRVTYSALDRALADIVKTPGSSVEIQDLGCSVGANSTNYCSLIVERLRALGDDRPMVLGLIDLPDNDWDALDEHIARTPVLQKKDVFVVPQSGTFYKRCAPPSSVHLSLSLIAPHWLRHAPKTNDLQRLPFTQPNEVTS